VNTGLGWHPVVSFGFKLSPARRAVAVALILALLGLVVVFELIVSGAVQTGEMRRRANAALADATWRCNALATRKVREACSVQLTAVPRDSAALRAQPGPLPAAQ
jgi:hypothetical protein